jgi:hemoglobin-like flavoprotein
MGPSWTKELAEAWTEAYGRVAKAMIEGADSVTEPTGPGRQAAE